MVYCNHRSLMERLQEHSQNSLIIEKENEELGIVGALFNKGTNIGYAYIDNGHTMHVMEDVEDFTQNHVSKSNVFFLTLVMQLYSPRLLLLNAPSNETGPTIRIDAFECEKRFVMEREFSAGKGVDLLSSQNLLTSNKNLRNYSFGLGCACAMMHHLGREKGDTDFIVQNVCFFSLNSCMELDMETLHSLEIFSIDAHPNGISGRDKEGFSIFNLLNFTRSVGGKKLLKHWLRRPLIEKQEIDCRLKSVEFFANPSHCSIVEELRVMLRKVSNMSLLFSNLRCSSRVSDVEKLYKFCKFLNQLMRIMHSVDAQAPILKDLCRIYNAETCLAIEERIAALVDFEQSVALDRISFYKGSNQQLDRLKSIYEMLPDMLQELAAEIAQELGMLNAHQLQVCCHPQIGYVVSLPVAYEFRLPDSFQIQSCTNELLYAKNAKMFQLDEEFGDIYSCIVDIEVEMAQSLKEDIFKHRQIMIDISLKLFEIDVLISFGEAAQKLSLTKPSIVYDSKIEAICCRHLLAESTCSNFIANNIHLDSGKVAILTGPNFSGKSVYLKQVGILCVLAQVGCFVPAEQAKIGIIDKLFTKISSRESITSGCSSFQAELNRMGAAIQHATKRSVILADEFGKGTEFNDGIGLFCSVIQHFSAKRPDCPRILFATHFHEAHPYLNDGSRFQWLKMNTCCEGTPKDVVFLYHLAEGVSDKSYSKLCAKLAGIPDDTISRAAEIAERYANYLPIESLNAIEKYKSAQILCNLLADLLNASAQEVDVLFDKVAKFHL